MKVFKFIFVVGVVVIMFVVVLVYVQFIECNICFFNGVNEDYFNGKGVEKFWVCFIDKLGGKLKVQGFWGNVFGGDLQVIQVFCFGIQEMVVILSLLLIGILLDFGVFDLFFFFVNEKEVDVVFDGSFGKYIDVKFEFVGFVNLVYWENGFCNFINLCCLVEKWEDFKGFKVCVMQNNVFFDIFKILGVNVVLMVFGEVFMVLEIKVIDGQENFFVIIDIFKFYEVQKYLLVICYVYMLFFVFYFKKLWDGLLKDEQVVLCDCVVVFWDEQCKVFCELLDVLFNKIKGEGIVVNELNVQEVNCMCEQVKSVWEKYVVIIGLEIVKMMQDELMKVWGK